MLIVQKYGGSSLANAELIKSVAERVASSHNHGDQVVVTVSAMGDSTDGLLQIAGEVSSLPNPRELDVLLSTGELQSCALVSMALQSLGKNSISLSAVSYTHLTLPTSDLV